MAEQTHQPVVSESDLGVLHSQDGVIIRSMNTYDCDFSGKLLVEGFRAKSVHAFGESALPKVVNASRDHRREIKDLYHRHFIAEIDGKPAAIMGLRFSADRSGSIFTWMQHLGCWNTIRIVYMGCALDESVTDRETCCLDHLVVDENFRGKGIGKILMDAAEKEAKANACKTMVLWVATDNRAKNLYERQGYQEVDRTEGCCVRGAFGVDGFLKMEKQLP